jgi:ATP-dependent DNA ligase
MVTTCSSSVTGSAGACSPATESGRFPLITKAALRNRNPSFVIDGEAVLFRHRRPVGFQRAAFWQARWRGRVLDMLVSDGEDLRKLPLSMRKNNLARLLARRVDGIHLAPFEQGEIGSDLFRHACLMGLEGLVSKHRESVYRAIRSPRWIKVKNRQRPAFSRVQDQF